jgi:hypothetical protein
LPWSSFGPGCWRAAGYSVMVNCRRARGTPVTSEGQRHGGAMAMRSGCTQENPFSGLGFRMARPSASKKTLNCTQENPFAGGESVYPGVLIHTGRRRTDPVGWPVEKMDHLGKSIGTTPSLNSSWIMPPCLPGVGVAGGFCRVLLGWRRARPAGADAGQHVHAAHGLRPWLRPHQLPRRLPAAAAAADCGGPRQGVRCWTRCLLWSTAC